MKIPEQRVGLVLCGGGSRGALEIGFYQALVEIGVPIDFIVGSSIGALNGALIAAGMSAKALCKLWGSVRFRDIFRLKWRSLVNPRAAGSIYDNGGLRRLLEKHLPVRWFGDLRIALTIIATDLETGESVCLERGDLIGAVLASVALPGLLPPVYWEMRQLVDGGLANNLPLDVAAEKGVTTILAVRCRCENTRREPIHGIVNILSRAFDITDSAKYQQDLRRYDGRTAMIVLQPCFDFDVGLLDFSHGKELISMAHDATMHERAAFTRLIIERQRIQGEQSIG